MLSAPQIKRKHKCKGNVDSQLTTHTLIPNLSYFLFIMILVGITLSCLSIKSCEFVKLPADHNDQVGDALGLHGFEDADTNECTPYGSSFSWDKSETLAQKGSLAAPIMASMALLLLFIEITCCASSFMRALLSLFLLVAILCQGLSFSFYNSNQFWYVLIALGISIVQCHFLRGRFL